jgi:hypothetical protein
MSNGQRLALASTLVIVASANAFAAPPSAQLLHHEAISINAHKSGTAERVSFDGFGKHFDITMQPNERVRGALKSNPNGIVPLRGTIDGIAHSWARLTRSTDGRWQGLLSDGQEIYAIEPAADVQSMAVEPIAMADLTPVMYRLSDLIVEWTPGFCEALPAGEKTTALDTFKALGAEVVAAEATGGVPTKQLSIGIVGDYKFTSYSYFNSGSMTPTQAVIARMNNVDGIFSDQVGVAINVPTITLQTTDSGQFTKTDSKQLLDQVRAFRHGSAEHSTRGLTHLMTGLDLDGDTVGIAYMGTVCAGEYAVSLSEGTRSTTMASLIAAHEIGHNFNAPHDGDPDGACASMPTTFLMSAQINYNNQFSSCSLQQMKTKIATASCLTAYSPPDAAIVIDTTPVRGTLNTALNVAFNVNAIGGTSSQSVLVTASVPAELTLNSVTASDGACTSGAGSVSCTLGTLEAGAARTITLNVTSQTVGTFPLDVTLSSSNDSVATNNTGRVDVAIAAAASAVPGSTASASSGGGGGGGSLSLGVLAALGGMFAFRVYRGTRLARVNRP